MTAQPYFAIFAVMRTGSNLLEKTLAELGDTVCYGEAFNPGFIGEPRSRELLGWNMVARDADPAGFLARMREAAQPAIPGFRVFRGHGKPTLKRLLGDPACRKIILRRDPLDSYISLKIAQETGQWMLRDRSRHIALRVAFDADEFTKYCATTDNYYSWIDDQLRKTGQAAFEVRYDQLSDRSVMQKIAHHIGSGGVVPDGAPIARQNSPRLSDKVSNYAEMCEALGLEPEVGAQRDLPAVTAADIMLPQRAPLVFAPLDGPGLEAGVSLIYRIERRAFDGPSLSQVTMMRQAQAGTLFPSLAEAKDLVGATSGRHTFAITVHPALRMRGLFEAAVLGPNWQRAPVRMALVSRLGSLPTPRDLQQGSIPEETWRAAFLAFLDLVAEARAGKGVILLPRAWRGQWELLDLYRDLLWFDRIVDVQDLQALSADLAKAMAVPRLPDSHVVAVLERAGRAHLPLSVLSDAEVNARLSDMFADDYAKLGYAVAGPSTPIAPSEA